MLHIFGIRHHGPGCARALLAALQALRPEILLVEGPPEGEEVLKLAASPEMKPPVALLVYPPEKPDAAVFYPFASFSPEWNAIEYSFKNDIPLRFFDLPWKHRFALDEEDETQERTENVSEKSFEQRIIDDPLNVLSQAAGFEDGETWWEQVIEQSRGESLEIFTGINEAMTALRERVAEDESGRKRRHEELREAWMRQSIRKAISDGFDNIAVICGAWHAPVLDLNAESKGIPSKKSDDALLNKLPKSKVATTWTPWTYSRLAYRSGYGAGVCVPGWYDHLWTSPDRAVIRWVALAARLLRDESLDASSANVIEAVRLAETLASMRNRPVPGIAEINEALLTVLCHGDATPLHFIRRRLETGLKIGSVPRETPAVPLFKDIEIEQKRLRMKVSEEIINADFDLRKETDRAKSRLLHRLNLLGIPWGTLQQGTVRSSGTFHEFWQIQWQVEFVVRIIEANMLGNTLEAAVTGAVRAKADSARSVSELTALIDAALPAEISQATLEELLERLKNEAAVSSDISGLMLALSPLVNVLRYGNVRGTKTERIEPVYDAIFQRVLIGLGPACASLDDEAAARRVTEIDAVHSSLKLHCTAEQLSDWQKTLAALSGNEVVHALLRGRCTRVLYEESVISTDDLRTYIGLAVSTALDSIKVAQWMQGFLYGSGQTLLHLDPLWSILNAWLCTLSEEVFTELLPLLRRAFSDFSGPELRMMGEKVRKLPLDSAGEAKAISPETSPEAANEARLNADRVEKMLPILRTILSPPEGSSR